jgi:hypothetical protein
MEPPEGAGFAGPRPPRTGDAMMWNALQLLRAQAFVEYVALQPGSAGRIGDIFRQATLVIRQNPLETAGLVLAVILVFVIVARFNSL